MNILSLNLLDLQKWQSHTSKICAYHVKDAKRKKKGIQGQVGKKREIFWSEQNLTAAILGHMV